jgi:hypothetical protein
MLRDRSPLCGLVQGGRRDRNRTCNLRIWRPLLCQLSYPPTPCQIIPYRAGVCKIRRATATSPYAARADATILLANVCLPQLPRSGGRRSRPAPPSPSGAGAARAGGPWQGFAGNIMQRRPLRLCRQKHTHFSRSGASLRTLQSPWQDLRRRGCTQGKGVCCWRIIRQQHTPFPLFGVKL